LGTRKVDFGGGPTLRAGYTAEGVINRKDFGLSFHKVAEGVSVVGDEVTLKFEIELYRKL
jgi:polyisoprenoid-binding protein YceI